MPEGGVIYVNELTQTSTNKRLSELSLARAHTTVPPTLPYCTGTQPVASGAINMTPTLTHSTEVLNTVPYSGPGKTVSSKMKFVARVRLRSGTCSTLPISLLLVSPTGAYFTSLFINAILGPSCLEIFPIEKSSHCGKLQRSHLQSNERDVGPR